MKRRVLSKMASFHPLFIKKKAWNGAVLTALWVFFFPWTCEAREEEDFFFPYSHCLLFSRWPGKTPTKDLSLAQSFPHIGGMVEGRQHSDSPGLSPPCFLPIKTREERAKKKRTRERAQVRADRREQQSREERAKGERAEKRNKEKEERTKRGKKRREEKIEKKKQGKKQWESSSLAPPPSPAAASCHLHRRQQHREPP